MKKTLNRILPTTNIVYHKIYYIINFKLDNIDTALRCLREGDYSSVYLYFLNFRRHDPIVNFGRRDNVE